MKKHCTIAILLFLICCHLKLFSQQNIIYRPFKYEEPARNIDTRPVNDSERDPVYPWFVVSVQDNVTTTSSPGDSQRFKTMRFGELFWVTGEQDNFLRIAKDDRRDDIMLSSQAEDYGWVNKDNVLMWNRALQNPETKISLKGLILNTTKALLSGGQTNFQKIQAYKDSDLRIGTGFEARLFEIFYIYKYSNNGRSVLLGRNPYFLHSQFDMHQVAGGLIGWVDLDRVLEWDHRVAVEPNFNREAVEERISKKIRSTIFAPSERGNPDECARKFAQSQTMTGCHVAWEDDYGAGGSFERKPGYWRRFPVIGDHDGSDFYNIMVMGELRGQMGRVISEDVDAHVRQRLNQIIEKVRNINVVFAIDGTNSMGPYYNSVINSVQRIVQSFESSGAEHKNLRFGYAVYRDYLERDRLLETRQLTSNSQSIINALRNVEARDLYDTHAHEAVYYGLRAAIKQVFTDPDETNILIHIGDAGNHSRNDPSQVSQNEIIELIADYKCYYIAYQAHHDTRHVAYDDFPRQVKEIMTKSSERLYRLWVDLLGASIISQRPVLREIDRNISRIEQGHPMLLIQSPRGRQMDITYLENEITRAIGEIDRYTDNVVERAREMLERGRGIEVLAGETDGMYASSFAGGVYNFLLRTGLPEDVLKDYYSLNVQAVIPGHASRNHQSLNRPLFVPVLLMTKTEFYSIINSVDRLFQVNQATGDQRQRLYDAWVELLKRHIGIRPQGFYDQLSLEDAAKMVFGVPMRSSMLQTIQLKDITDPAVFPNRDLSMYINQIGFKSRQLNAIANAKDYPYSFMSNDIMYYWVDVELIP